MSPAVLAELRGLASLIERRDREVTGLCRKAEAGETAYYVIDERIADLNEEVLEVARYVVWAAREAGVI